MPPAPPWHVSAVFLSSLAFIQRCSQLNYAYQDEGEKSTISLPIFTLTNLFSVKVEYGCNSVLLIVPE